MFPDVKYEVRKVSLKVGDVALIFTDGITESRNKGNDEFGEEKLTELIRKNSKLSAQKLLEKIHEKVKSFTAGTDPMDDMTLVVIKKVS